MRNPQAIIADEAEKMVGLREVTHNEAPWLPKIWAATWYKDGMENHEPYCAAAVCHWIQQADLHSTDVNLKHPPLSPSCSDLLEWFSKPEQGCMVFKWTNNKGILIPQRGDIVFYMPYFSHVGVVSSVNLTSIISTEANTNQAGSREGDGIWQKERAQSICGTFVRLPVTTKAV